MPWLTPNDIPEGVDCRPLSIPADTSWLALIGGALTELTKSYNWQQFGALTVDETVAKMQEIIDAYYSEPCTQCTLPGGSKVIRLTPSGHIQELNDSGEWDDPTGDYVIPPPEARTGGTSFDQKCLAAKNAVNVLHTLYEDLADSWSSHLSEAEALTAFTIALVGLVGFEFAPITGAIVIFFSAVFTALYEALAYLGADLWDDAVSNQIQCFLLACASNDAGVVTFDYNCFVDNLNSLTNDFLLSETQLRLYLQITFILYFIGGIDGLNLAGRTTAITDDTCTDCDTSWCNRVDASNIFNEFASLDWNGCPGDTPGVFSDPVWDSGLVVIDGCSGHNVTYLHLRVELAESTFVTDVAAHLASGSPSSRTIWANGDGSLFSGTNIYNSGWIGGSGLLVDSFDILFFTVDDTAPFTMDWFQCSGTGDPAFFPENCP